MRSAVGGMKAFLTRIFSAKDKRRFRIEFFEAGRNHRHTQV